MASLTEIKNRRKAQQQQEQPRRSLSQIIETRRPKDWKITTPTVAEEKAARRAAGLAVSTSKRRVAPTFGGEIVRGIVRAPATLLARPAQLGMAVGGATPEEQTIRSGYLGDIKTSENAGDVLKDVGRGIETVSLGIGGGAARAGVTARQAIKQLVKEGAVAGGVGSLGYGISEGQSVPELLKTVATGTVAGGVLNTAIGRVFKPKTIEQRAAERAFGKSGKPFIPEAGVPTTRDIVDDVVDVTPTTPTPKKQRIIAEVKPSTASDYDDVSRMYNAGKLDDNGLREVIIGRYGASPDVADSVIAYAKDARDIDGSLLTGDWLASTIDNNGIPVPPPRVTNAREARLAALAVKDKLELDPNLQLNTHEFRTVKEQEQLAEEFGANMDNVMAVLRGEMQPPGALLPESVDAYARNVARKNGDVELINFLASDENKVSSSISREAQGMRFSQLYMDEYDPVSVIKRTKKDIEDIYKQRTGKDYKKERAAISKSLDEKKLVSIKGTVLSDFIKSIEC